MTAEIESFIRDAASKRGIDPGIAIRVARSEGGVDEYCAVGRFETGWSFWPFQLHYGGDEYPQFGTVAGMGNGFTKLTAWAPGVDAAWRDSTRYALNRAKAGGWSPWYGAAAVGVSQWEGINRAAPWDANAERWDYEGVPAELAYNAQQPPERQVQDWTCSIRSTAWALKSLGLPVDIGALQDEMTPRYVTPELGLRDGRGYGIAEVLRAHLPAEWDSRVEVYERIDWAGLWIRSGGGPICLGLHGAYHWINVAAPQSDGSVVAPNPAPKYPGAAPIGDILTEVEFDQYGPASAVWIDAAPRLGEAPTAPYVVGPGLLSAMQAQGDVPASDEVFIKAGARDAWSEAIGQPSGSAYRWVPSVGRVWRYPPST